jgi:tetratricopeptide (TPR) repeat protein
VKRSVRVVLVVLALFAVTSAGVLAQKFSPQAQYLQCSAFFEQGDLETALNACRLAVTAQPNFAGALRLLARIQLAQNQPLDAKSSLEQARIAEPQSTENDLIGGEIALIEGDASRANQLAKQLLVDGTLRPGSQVRALKLAAKSARALGRNDETTDYYRRVLSTDPSDLETRSALAANLLETDPNAAVRLLREATSQTPITLAELGRAQWIAGDLGDAINTLERAISNPLNFTNNRPTYERALGALAYAYYGQGRFTEGQRVLAQISGDRNLFITAVNRVLPWLLLMIVLLALHLFGESRIEPLSTIEIQEGPRPWTVSNVYGVVLSSALVAGIVALLAGRVIYGNFLAILTPTQSGVARDIYFSVFAVTLAALSFRNARRAGWNPRDLLVGPLRRDLVVDGAAIGLGLVAVTLLYQFAVHALHITLDGFYLGVFTPRWTLILPILTLPLTEIFFRAYASYPLEKRYGRDIAYPALAVMYALCLGAPIMLLVIGAVVLLFLANRLRSTAPAMVAQWVYYAVLALIVSSLPIVRTWFA